MARIFVSYSSADKPTVSGLAEDLSELGHTVWIDRQLRGGQEWWDEILAEIRGCEVFATVLTNAFLQSEACRSEWTYAQALSKTILPIRLNEQVDLDRISPDLLKRQIVDYGEGEKAGVLALHKSLNELDAFAALPDPLPEPPPVPISYVARILEEIRHPKELTFDEQIAIVYRLRDHFRETGSAEDVRKALEQLGGRRDLFARVKDEMTALIQEASPSQASPLPDESEPAIPNQKDSNKSKQSSKSSDKGAGTIAILCFLFPIVGLILYLVWRDDRPKSAKEAGVAGLIGFGLWSCLYTSMLGGF